MLAVAISGPPAHAQVTAQWQFTGSMASGHGQANLAQLADGRVLAIGGDAGGFLTNSVEIYSPATGQWAPVGCAQCRPWRFSPAVSAAGRQTLVATGDVANSVETNTAEIYDPNTSTWSITGSVNQGRRADVQVGLANGEVLIATGAYGGPTCGRFLSSAELYNPAAEEVDCTGSTLVPREGAFAVRLADGHVLLAGGYNGGTNCTDTDPVDTEIYRSRPASGPSPETCPTAGLTERWFCCQMHRVLLVGGWQHGGEQRAEAEISTPQPASGLRLPRRSCRASAPTPRSCRTATS